MLRNSRMQRRRWKRPKAALIADWLHRDRALFSAWLFVMERAVRRDLRLRPHRVALLRGLRLDERGSTLLMAALRSSRL